jgi:tetratricopeptide (TPR) repeat protein
MTITWEQLMASADEAYLKGDIDAARDQWLQAVRVAEEGDDLKKASNTLDRLAEALVQQRKYGDAASVFSMAVEVKSEVFGPSSMEMISTLSGLVDALHAQDKFEEALPFACQWLEAYKTAFGAEHPGAVLIATNMASKYHDAHNPQAEEFYKQALAVKSKSLGYKHPDVVSLTERYAALLSELGREKEATELMENMVSSASGVWKTFSASTDPANKGDKLADRAVRKTREQQ